MRILGVHPTCLQQTDAIIHSSTIIKEERHLLTRVALEVEWDPVDAIVGETIEPRAVVAIIQQPSLVIQDPLGLGLKARITRSGIGSARRSKLGQPFIEAMTDYRRRTCCHSSAPCTASRNRRTNAAGSSEPHTLRPMATPAPPAATTIEEWLKRRILHGSDYPFPPARLPFLLRTGLFPPERKNPLDLDLRIKDTFRFGPGYASRVLELLGVEQGSPTGSPPPPSSGENPG